MPASRSGDVLVCLVAYAMIRRDIFCMLHLRLGAAGFAMLQLTGVIIALCDVCCLCCLQEMAEREVVRAAASGNVWCSASHPEHVRPMLQVCWWIEGRVF
jgi:hypothetical protein